MTETTGLLLYYAQMLLFAAITLMALAAAGSPWLAVLCERRAVATRKVFFDKFAMQIASMGVVLGAFSLLLGLLAGVLLLRTLESVLPLELPFPVVLQQRTNLPTLIVAALPLLSVILLAAYRKIWPGLKGRKTPHSMLGLTAALLALLALAGFLLFKRFLLTKAGIEPVEMSVSLFLDTALGLALPSIFWPLLVLGSALMLATAATLGLLYLLLRRNAEDFGRDYYAFAAGLSARWGCYAGLAVAVAYGWLAAVRAPRLGFLSLGNPNYFHLAAAIILQLLASYSCVQVFRSQTPLREKPAMILGALFLMLSLVAGGVLLDRIIFL